MIPSSHQVIFSIKMVTMFDKQQTNAICKRHFIRNTLEWLKWFLVIIYVSAEETFRTFLHTHFPHALQMEWTR